MSKKNKLLSEMLLNILENKSSIDEEIIKLTNKIALQNIKLTNIINYAIKFIEEEPLFEDSFNEGEDTFLEDVNTKYYAELKNILKGDKE